MDLLEVMRPLPRYEERVQISQTQSIWQLIRSSEIEEIEGGDLRFSVPCGLAGTGEIVEAVRVLPKSLWRRV